MRTRLDPEREARALAHDPFCPTYYPHLIPAYDCRYCYLIFRVREDERSRLSSDN